MEKIQVYGKVLATEQNDIKREVLQFCFNFLEYYQKPLSEGASVLVDLKSYHEQNTIDTFIRALAKQNLTVTQRRPQETIYTIKLTKIID